MSFTKMTKIVCVFIVCLCVFCFGMFNVCAENETEVVTGISDGAVDINELSADDAEDEALDLTDFDTAADYLNNYTTNSSDDAEFEANSATSFETVRSKVPVFGKIWALLPALIAIALALITKEVYSSLFVGIVVGGLFLANFSITTTVDNVVNNGFISSISDTAGIFLFLVLLGILVALINKSGGSAAFGKWVSKHIHSRIGASIATFVLGILIFIDDYFNCLTVGSVMRPVTDSKKISRAKLAFLIDATAAPVCMIAPISSWAAAVASYTEEGQGLKLFIQAIPYNFYSRFTIGKDKSVFRGKISARFCLVTCNTPV